MDTLRELNNGDIFDEIQKNCENNINSIQYYEKEMGFSLLVMFLSRGKLDFAEWLVDNGAEINVSNDGTPLSKACFNGNPSIIKKILSKSTEEFISKSCPMEQAIYSTKTTNVEVLLKSGFGINGKDKNGYSPLCYALSSIETLEFEDAKEETYLKRSLRMVEFLLQKGALLDEEAKNILSYVFELESENKRNILSICTYFMRKELNKSPSKELPFKYLFRWLLENSTQPLTPNTYSIEKDNTLAITSLLTDLVILPDTEPIEFYSRYMDLEKYDEDSQFEAIINSVLPESTEILLKSGINPDAKKEDLSALSFCISNKKFHTARLLINFGANILSKDTYNRDALFALISTANRDDENTGALIVLKAIMDKNPDLLQYSMNNIVLDHPEIHDIFDIAVKRRIYHWFEPFIDQMNEKEKWVFTEKRLFNAIYENEEPETIYLIKN